MEVNPGEIWLLRSALGGRIKWEILAVEGDKVVALHLGGAATFDVGEVHEIGVARNVNSGRWVRLFFSFERRVWR